MTQQKNTLTSPGTPRFARLSMRFRCSGKEDLKNHIENYANSFQEYAVENIYHEMGIPSSEVIVVNQDQTVNTRERIVLVVHNWFVNSDSFISSSNVTPVFLSFYLNDQMHKEFVKSSTVDKMKQLGQPIGCRDKKTANFLVSQGIEAYVSGYLSLTFSKRRREPKNGRVFVVEVSDECLKKVPKTLLKKAVFESQVANVHFSNEEYVFENKGRELLTRWKTKARLIVTSQIHVAIPCVAMGVPVVVLSDEPTDSCVKELDGIVKVYLKNETDSIDWNPSVPNIEVVKDVVKANALGRIKQAVQKLKQENAE